MAARVSVVGLDVVSSLVATTLAGVLVSVVVSALATVSVAVVVSAVSVGVV